jgi:hypothetical protein
MAYYTTNEKIYPFLGDHRRGFELFWQTAYVLHLEGRKGHSSHRGAGFAEVAAAAVHPATVWLELPEHHTTTQLRYVGLFGYQGKLHQILCVFLMRPHRRCIIKTSHIADPFLIRRAKAANLL